ncbi:MULTISPECIES: hypothetical protein [Haloferax]|uniref:Uncharacterized protein n=1 Tax=Haloferax marinisediminis TaxID=2666142 RepID=A0A6G1Z384_9EURY|nr:MULTISPECIES: hypothetical protein [Haloferax]MRW80963.1 hypothetical protein [Haloferax marinisediminis]
MSVVTRERLVGLLVAIVVAEILFLVAPSGPAYSIPILVGSVALGLWAGRVLEQRV